MGGGHEVLLGFYFFGTRSVNLNIVMLSSFVIYASCMVIVRWVLTTLIIYNRSMC